jgi:hypothetical protein
LDVMMTAAWAAVIVAGLYHGLNPAMGWPLAVAAGLLERRRAALAGALGALTFGHLLAVLALMLPFALLVQLAQWERQLRITAACVVLAFGLVRLVQRRHPRLLARIAPSRVALWSFVAAIAHGAGLMLVPIFLGMCRPADLDPAHQAAAQLMRSNVGLALQVALVHSLAMVVAGGACAWLTYRYLGLGTLRRAWWDTDVLWNVTLVMVGGVALGFALVG